MKNTIKRALITSVIFILAFQFNSCSKISRGEPFTTSLDYIDSYIRQNLTKEASKSLKKLEKKAYSSFERLGIYKRYITLGDEKSAEKLLVKGLKIFGKNPELSAVYSELLIHQNRFEEAKKIAKCLENTPYSSIYAEVLLRDFIEKYKDFPEDEKLDFLLEKDNLEIFKNAYKAGNDEKWLVNAACIHLNEGNYDEAALCAPKEIHESNYFWGCTYYDSKKYQNSIDVLANSTEIYSRELICDNLYNLLRENEAEEERQTILLTMKDVADPKITLNCAMYAKKHKNYDILYNYLNELKTERPDFVSGLSAWCEYAISFSKKTDDSEFEKELRVMGIKSLAMIKRDSIPVVGIKDALEDTKKSVEACEDKTEINILLDKIEWIDMLSSFPTKQTERHYGRTWQFLEKNETNNFYPESTVQYAISNFIQDNYINDAINLNEIYLNHKYGDNFIDYTQMTINECEFLAFLLVQQNKLIEAKEIYEYLCSKAKDRSSLKLRTLLNLSWIYQDLKQMEKQKNVLVEANGISMDAKEKSQIEYRIAQNLYSAGDTISAIKTLESCIRLDKDNNDARLFLKKITAY